MTHEIVGVVDVENDELRRRLVTSAIEVDEADADAVERLDVGKVLQPRDRRLARNVVAANPTASSPSIEAHRMLRRIERVRVWASRLECALLVRH